jgi:hypothetical protein
VQTVRGETLDVALAEALMIVLASYFATRRVIDLPPDVLPPWAESTTQCLLHLLFRCSVIPYELLPAAASRTRRRWASSV